MAEANPRYIPAAGHDWLLPFYDATLRWIGAEKVKLELIEQLELTAGQHVLDLGCGTGSLTVLMKRKHPDAQIRGLDPDPKALDRSRQRAKRAGAAIDFEQGFAGQLPYDAATFDRVVSSFMFHHLTLEQKHGMLAETLRVLKPGGRLYLLDFAPGGTRTDTWFARLFHSDEDLRDNMQGKIATYLTAAGFADVREQYRRGTLMGQAACYVGVVSD